jgi:hypothetical protein
MNFVPALSCGYIKLSPLLSCLAGVDFVELLTRVTMHNTAAGSGTDKMKESGDTERRRGERP